jgi:putative ABC transport system permease protein
LAGASATNRLLQTQLTHVAPADPLVLGLAAITVMAAVVAATLVPTRRALRIDPAVALKQP